MAVATQARWSRSSIALNSKASIIALALACTACATSIDPSTALSVGGTEITGGVQAFYVSVSAAGPFIAYETGSNAGLVSASASTQANIIRAEAASEHARVRVEGPSAFAPDMAEMLASGLEVATPWRPSDFSDEFQVSLDLVPNGPIDFSQRFAFQSAPWPMAFRARYDQVASPEDRAKLAATISHEAYHLANAVSGEGSNLTAFESRRDAGWIYEETAALLLGACTTVSLGFAADLETTPSAVLDLVHPETGEEREVIAPFDDDLTARLVTALEAPHARGTFPRLPVYIGFYRTLFDRYANGADHIEPGSLAADRLLSACARLGPDVQQVPIELLNAAEGGERS